MTGNGANVILLYVFESLDVIDTSELDFVRRILGRESVDDDGMSVVVVEATAIVKYSGIKVLVCHRQPVCEYSE